MPSCYLPPVVLLSLAAMAAASASHQHRRRVCHLIMLLLLPLASSARDSISSDSPLMGNETLVSDGSGNFVFGFFTPHGSRKTYLGVWYAQVAPRTVVWVANPDAPLHGTVEENAEASLQLLHDGHALDLTTNYREEVVYSWWFVNKEQWALDAASTARILDNGNLVLLDAQGSVLWQGFDHPSDTLLPGMSLGLDVALVAWRSPSDPSSTPIKLSIDASGVPEVSIWKNSTKIWRSGPWDGVRFTDIAAGNSSFVGVNKTLTYEAGNSSTMSRLVLNSTGGGGWMLQRWTWVEAAGAGAWRLDWYAPRDQCDTVSRCGVNAVCDTSDPLLCSCLPGFTPQTTAARDGEDGCGRKAPLGCPNGTDVFALVPYANAPVTASGSALMDLAASLEECRQRCLGNCSCTAYAGVNASGGPGQRGCIMWTGGLADVRVHPAYDGGDLYVRLAAADPGSPSKARKKKEPIIVAIIVSITAVSFLLSVVGFFIWRVRRGNGEEGNLELPIYDVETIAAATDNFSANNKLGEGGFGPVYKGKLEDGQEIAVKTLSKKSKQGLDEFMNEVKLIAKLQHRNLVRLIGCSIAGEEKMLIYEYMANKSLDYFLDRTKSMLLDWPTRYHIIEGIARGLLYLQQDSRYRIIHRDLKPANILLDTDMTPKISDFGFARMFDSEDTEINNGSGRVAGTCGYIAPEYAKNAVCSMKSDVFSFGVIVLEITTGERRNRKVYTDHVSLLEHAWTFWNEGNSLDLVDENLNGSFNSDEVVKCLKLGLLCVQDRPEDRPLMSQVLQMLASAETSSLQAPKQPGCSTSRPEYCSVADSMTASLFEGR